jgi:hypothetical protein
MIGGVLVAGWIGFCLMTHHDWIHHRGNLLVAVIAAIVLLHFGRLNVVERLPPLEMQRQD